MAELRDGREMEGHADEFGRQIERLRRDGINSYLLGRHIPWEEVAPTRKLEEIVWLSMFVQPLAEEALAGAGSLRAIDVPGISTLEVVEREVDYAGLPAVQREMLLNLRASVDSGQLGEGQPDYKDLAKLALARIVGVGHFDQMLQAAKESEGRPWSGLSEADKVSRLVDLAQDAGPPGGYTLWVIEREVDYDKLPTWRRQALEQLRDRFEAGELDGENPNPSYLGDRAEYALRLAELEARIVEYKHASIADDSGIERRWPDLTEGEKFDRIMDEMRELHLESEPAAYFAIAREVDMTLAPEERRREFESHSARQVLPSPSDIADRRRSHPPEQDRGKENGFDLGR